MDSQNRLDEDYEDGDGDGTNYDYDEMRIEIDEEDVTLPAPRIFHQTNISHCVNSFHGLPEYFLAELQLV
ncbi:MAG: hypothetical protein K1X86_00240 [Ignavibacteria bacterium]|nr:hypothetical protein [Ignavibacteria bacterium]